MGAIVLSIPCKLPGIFWQLLVHNLAVSGLQTSYLRNSHFRKRRYVWRNRGHGNFTNGFILSIFLFQNISQNEFTEINTDIGLSHMPGVRLWNLYWVPVSTARYDTYRLKIIIKMGDYEICFSVVDLNRICKERCEASHLQCILDCPTDDVTCLSKCIREETDCFSGKLSMSSLRDSFSLSSKTYL